MDEVQYTMTRDDVWHLQLYALSRQLRRTIRLRFIISSVLLVCLFIVLSQLFSVDYRLSILIVVFALFFALFLIFLTYCLVFFQLWLAASRSNEMLGKSGVNVLSISEQGVQLRNEISNGTSSWRAYKAIEEDKRNIYFVMDQPGRGFMARLIPKRAFESSSQAERFMTRARGYWQEQARQVTTSHS